MKLIVVLPLLLSSVFGQSRPRMDPVPTLASTIETAGPVANYGPPTVTDRVKWFALTTAGSLSLLAVGPLSSGWGTMLNKPKEYGPHWEGFAERYGVRLTGLSTGNAMEAGLGALWGEDPRYFPSPTHGFGPRVKYVIRSSFVALHRDGDSIRRTRALPGTWGTMSYRTGGECRVRTGWGALPCGSCGAWQKTWAGMRIPSSGRM